jgi:hypothetical protein
MTIRCTALHCAEPVSGYSTLCESHKRTLRRHGHALQKGVTALELKPFQERIAARRAKNPTNHLWELLQGRWDALTAHAKAMLVTHANGTASISYEHQAAEQLSTLGSTVPMNVVIDTALAMFLMWEQHPHRFMSDKAFNFQLARRVRSLAETNSGSHYSAKEGRLKRTYKDTPPRTLDCLAESLKVAFGVAGMRLSELERADEKKMINEKLQLAAALKEIT